MGTNQEASPLQMATAGTLGPDRVLSSHFLWCKLPRHIKDIPVIHLLPLHLSVYFFKILLCIASCHLGRLCVTFCPPKSEGSFLKGDALFSCCHSAFVADSTKRIDCSRKAENWKFNKRRRERKELGTVHEIVAFQVSSSRNLRLSNFLVLLSVYFYQTSCHPHDSESRAATIFLKR